MGFHIIFSEKDGRVIVRHKPELHRQGYPGVVHGAWCWERFWTRPWAGCPPLNTSGSTSRGSSPSGIIKPFPVEKTIIVECWPEKSKPEDGVEISGEVRDEEDTVYASAQGKYLPMSEEETRHIDEMLIYDPDTLRVFDSGDSGRKMNHR